MTEKLTYEELAQRGRELEASESKSKRMLEELHQKGSLYQNIFKHMLHEVHVWELVFDDHGNIKTWRLADANPAALKSWNKSLPEIIGKTTDEIFPYSNATELFMPIVEKIYRKGTPHRWESYFPDTQQVLHMISVSFGNYFISTGFDITERKQSEEKLKKSQNLLSELTNQVPGVLYQFYSRPDGKMGLYYVSDRSEDIFGLKADLDGFFERFTELIMPEYRKDFLLSIQKATEEVVPWHFESILQKPTGERIWFSGHSTPSIRNTEVVFNGIILDITDRKLAEEEHRKSDERFRIAQEMSPDGFTILRPVRDDQDRVIDFIWIYENEAVARMNGTDPQKVAGQRLLELFPGHQGTQFFNAYKQVAETGKPITFEEGYVGETIKKKTWFRIVVVPMAENIAILNHDITERKIAEENLINTFNLSPSIIAKANLKTGFYIEANQAVTRILGYSIEEFTSKPIKEFIHPDDKETTIKAMSEQLEGKEILIENRFLCKKGSYKWISWNANSANDEGIVLGVGSDVTERKKLQEKLNQTQRMESVGNLAGGIAHDFNNILSSIIGFTELALDDVEKNSLIEDNLQEVYTAGKRAKELVGQILAFARQSEEKLKPIQIDKIIKEVLQFIRSSIPTSIEIKTDIDSDSLIMGNQTQVHQILMNLCTNAAHAMEDDGGVLNVSLKDVVVDRGFSDKKLDLTHGDYIEITVSDTGTGIPPEIVDSIFEPYFTTKGPGEGTGMGLAVVMGIVESYGGKITVNSKLGQGTTFKIYFPVTRKRRGHHQYEPEPLPTGTERILFVDDEAPIAKMGKRTLAQLGYSVEIRTSSIEALELFQAKPKDFDLILTDMTMPNMTGDKLAIELMKIRRDIPIILCTGYSKKISDEISKEIGIKAFVYKPFVKADLAKIVRKVLDEAKGSA